MDDLEEGQWLIRGLHWRTIAVVCLVGMVVVVAVGDVDSSRTAGAAVGLLFFSLMTEWLARACLKAYGDED